ncbi:MAG: double-strand break repair protein AddB [Rhodospirillales bacterium]
MTVPLTGIHTLPPGYGFADALARGLLDRYAEALDDLADVLILLPTRRALPALREAFLRQGAGRVMLLPRMMPLGDVDEDDLAFEDPIDLPEEARDLPPALSGLKRQMILARLVMARPDPFRDGGRTAPDQALRLAVELGRLIDQAATERCDFSKLGDLVQDRDLAQHWQQTVTFLEIVTDAWPKALAELGAIDAVDRRNRLLEARAESWRRNPPRTPVIAAGTTGSIPATADLLAVVRDLPQGLILLPGLDTGLDDDAWAHLDAVHPQAGLKRLLDRLEVARKDVTPWLPASRQPTPEPRARLLAEALRPSDAKPQVPGPVHPVALEGLARLDCPTPRDEALAIALVLREALEVPGKRALLVTPDRQLARRVESEMARWGLQLDDSAGRPLNVTPPGSFLRLIADMVAEDFAPVPLLACLKHPLAAGGLEPARFRSLARRLERQLLRGVRPAPGLQGLRAENPGEDLEAFLDRLDRLISPFRDVMGKGNALPMGTYLRAHAEAAEALAATADELGPLRLWADDSGEALATFFAELDEAASDLGPVEARHYPALLDQLLEARVVRPSHSTHPRLAVVGLLEARLQTADTVILAGLNEGTWPPDAPASPWMSRPMMKAFGLGEPERRIGLTAHDFQQAFSAPNVVLTRSQRVDGAPAVPSRWLLKLDNRLGEDLAESLQARGDALRAWTESLDSPEKLAPPPRPPAAHPPVAARPRELWATDIEAWMRDPYGLYAKRVLKLRALDPLDASPSAADYGTVIHEALEAFVRAGLPPSAPDAYDRLLDCGREAFGGELGRPGIRAFWWPRFERIARWFLASERNRAPHLSASQVEVQGAVTLQGPAGPFTLRAKADRIDRGTDGRLTVIDYKTGQPPSKKEVAAGYSPQLPLEGWIAAEGGFDGVSAGSIAALDFWWLRGTDEGGQVKSAGDDLATLIAEAKGGLQGLVDHYDRPDTPYEARPNPARAPKYSDYQHLARWKEWASQGDDRDDASGDGGGS